MIHRLHRHRTSAVRPLLLLLVPLIAGACTGFRETAPGIWRSPQPGEDRLVRRIQANGIRTVVSLRGGTGARLTERATHAAGASYHAVPMSASQLPRPEQLLELWQIASEAERPIMVHCKAGVDRTGLVSGILILHDTGDLSAARGQLALIPYGHTGLFGTDAMGEVWDRYEPYAAQMTFPQWVRRIYATEVPDAPPEPPSELP